MIISVADISIIVQNVGRYVALAKMARTKNIKYDDKW